MPVPPEVSVKALMVDVDGVLVRGRPDDGRHWSAMLEADLGLRPADLQREFFAVHWEEIVLGRADLPDRLAPVLAGIAPSLPPERLIAYWFQQDARLDRALLGELAVLRNAGLAIHLATNQEHRRARYLMETLGLARHVDGIHYSAELGVKKPQPAFFEAVAARLALDPDQLLLIDDTPENIAAAEAAGWQARHWTGMGGLTPLLHYPSPSR